MKNSNLIIKFYDSFAAGDAEGMVNCYTDQIIFSDPAFGELRNDDARNMWRMLLKNNKGKISITYDDVTADEKTGSANWRAEYTFSKTGRLVINKISARFEFENGKMSRHIDHFDMWKWSGQALGWKGYLLGWTPFMKNKIRQQTKALLKAFTKK